MRVDPCQDSRFEGELTALLSDKQSSDDASVREALFAALSRLERQALIAGAADTTLHKIAEARFLVGILRDAMRPSRIAPLRSLLRLAGETRPLAEADPPEAGFKSGRCAIPETCKAPWDLRVSQVFDTPLVIPGPRNGARN